MLQVTGLAAVVLGVCEIYSSGSKKRLLQALAVVFGAISGLPWCISPLKHFYLAACAPLMQHMFDTCCWCASSNLFCVAARSCWVVLAA